MIKIRHCGDMRDCSECTIRHCPNLEPLDPDDQESLASQFYRACHEEEPLPEWTEDDE